MVCTFSQVSDDSLSDVLSEASVCKHAITLVDLMAKQVKISTAFTDCLKERENVETEKTDSFQKYERTLDLYSVKFYNLSCFF